MAEVEAIFLNPFGDAHTNILRSMSRQQADRLRVFIHKAKRKYQQISVLVFLQVNMK